MCSEAFCKPEFIKLYGIFETGGSIPLAEAEGKTMVSSFNCPQSMYMWVWFEKGALQILMGIDPCVFPKWNLKVIYKTYLRRNIHTQLHFTYILIITTVYIYIYMYINIYMYIHTYIYVHTYIYIDARTHIYIYGGFLANNPQIPRQERWIEALYRLEYSY